MPPTAEHRLPIPRATWMAARARNAMQRPIFIGSVSVGTFVTALVAMIVMPQQAQRAARAIAPKPGERPDTLAVAQRIAVAERQLADANAELAAARVRTNAIVRAATDTLSPELMARRDSLGVRVADLDRLIARTEASPLAASYRALADARDVAGDPRVRPLLDSLSDIEREREGFGATGGADPVFVALTTRATEIGRSLQRVAGERRDALRAEMTRLAPPPRPSSTALAAADTIRRIAARDAAQSVLATETARLAADRATLDSIDRRIALARERAAYIAPPYALLASAIVFGIVLGFGAALTQELRRPRIANQMEAERIAGVRVVSVIRPRPPSPERNRRLADRLAPPFIDPLNSGHQLVWLFVAPPASSLLLLTVSGDNPAVAGIVAANLAAIAADEARNVIVVDTDVARSPLSAALRIPSRPGIDDIVGKRVAWAEATRQATIGRDRVIDVVPGGSGTGAPPTINEISELLRRESARLARHYDTIVISASREQTLSGLPGVLPRHEVLYCARVGLTRLADLRKAMDDIRLAGGIPVGIVLWDDLVPTLDPSSPSTAVSAATRTAEMEAFVAGRQR